MVKIPKPTPKTFAKTGPIEEASKKKKSEKALKSKASKKIESSASVDVPAPAAVPEPKKSKLKLIKETIKEAALVEPLKKEKKQKNVEKQEEQPKPKKEKKIKNEQQEVASPVPKRRPLILAPPESPAVVSEPKKSKKSKAPKKETAVPPVPADAAAVGAAVTAKKPNKKQKKTKGKTATAAKDGTAVVAPKKPKQPQPALTKMQQKKATKRAFKKQQVKNKRAGKEPKQRAPAEYTFEPVPFDEDTFHAIVNTANVKKIAKALKTQVEREVNEKKTAIFSDYRYHLNVANFKIPNCPKRMVKLNLKHSLVDKDDDVVIIVPDLQRGAKVEYESTVHHYEDLFREAGVEGMKIMPFNQLRNECNTFEAVRKLGNTYDYFLCDGRLVATVAGFCGKVFQKPRTTFHAVRLDNVRNLKAEVDKSLRRTAYRQLQKGDLTSIPVGHHNFTMQQLTENIEHVVAQLKTIFPGGLGNVRSLYLRIDIAGTSSLPLYISTAQVAPETPYVVGPREQRMLALKKDANEVLTNFNINKDGDFVKLNKAQAERKRKYKEARAVLDAIPTAVLAPEAEAEVDVAVESAAETAVVVPPPSKKARKATKEEETTSAVVVAKDKKKTKKPKKSAKVVAKQENDAEQSD